MNNKPQTCPDCGSALPANAPKGLCPKCLVGLASAPWSEEGAIVSATNAEAGTGIPELRPFGDYRLLGEIASGGMGIVYRARQISLNRLVALKMIRAGHLASEAEVHRFRTEAEAAASLDHPNIVAIYEIGHYEGQHYFSMKLVEGNDLASELLGGPLPMRRAAQLLATVARAVHHAHQRGVLHRDLKPSNILLDDAGVPHLTDFGLAKLIESDRDLTRTNLVMGTISYMPPEQARGKSKQITTSGDIYSLGAILYQTLAGRPPFVGEDSVQMLRQVIESEPCSLRSLNPEIDPDLETICLKCLEKDSHRRYPTGEALADDLDRWLRGEPITARPVTMAERGLKWIRRHPLAAGLITAILTSLLLGMMAMNQLQRAKAARALSLLQSAEAHFDNHDAPLALADLARLLRDQPHNRLAAERLVNALRQRVFLFPAGAARKPPNSAPSSQDQLLSTPDGPRLLRHSDPVSIEIVDGLSGAQRLVISNAHQKVIRSRRWSADGRFIVTASADHTAKLWNAANGSNVLTVTNTDAVNYAELNVAGTRLLTACRDGTARLWNSADGASVGQPMRHPNSVNKAHFSPDGGRIVTTCDEVKAAYNSLVLLWGTNSDQAASEPFRLAAAVDDAWFSADNRHVTVGLATQETLTCNITAGLTLWAAEDRIVGSSQTNFLSPDGLRLAVADPNRRVRLLDVRTRHPLSDWILSPAPVAHAWFSDDGHWLITSAGWRWDLLIPNVPAPAWLPQLAEAIGGIRLDPQQQEQTIPPQALANLANLLSQTDLENPLTTWARQLIADEPVPRSE